jgi:hypothetical protein
LSVESANKSEALRNICTVPGIFIPIDERKVAFVLSLFKLKMRSRYVRCDSDEAIPADRIDCAVLIESMYELYCMGLTHGLHPLSIDINQSQQYVPSRFECGHMIVLPITQLQFGFHIQRRRSHMMVKLIHAKWALFPAQAVIRTRNPALPSGDCLRLRGETSLVWPRQQPVRAVLFEQVAARRERQASSRGPRRTFHSAPVCCASFVAARACGSDRRGSDYPQIYPREIQGFRITQLLPSAVPASSSAVLSFPR